MDTKRCKTCGEYKILTDFYKSKNGRELSCKECRKQRMRDIYQKNPQEKIAKAHAYHLAHPEWSKTVLREWHLKNAEQRYEKHKERGKDPKVAEARRDATRRCESKRRALKRTTQVETITKQQYDDILCSYDNKCWICEIELNNVKIHWDHFKPLAHGGTHTIDNLRPACDLCNIRKNSRWPFTDDMREEIRCAVEELREQRGEVVP
jgi:hypothetical protein